MLMLLKDFSMTAARRVWVAVGVIGASVQMISRRVAMFGWIIPAPLVIPTMLYRVSRMPGKLNCLLRSLGKVSVVQMA